MPRGTGMTVTRRRSRLPVSPLIPERFQSFDGWLQPDGLRQYSRELIQATEGTAGLVDALASGGLTVAGWYRRMLTDAA